LQDFEAVARFHITVLALAEFIDFLKPVCRRIAVIH